MKLKILIIIILLIGIIVYGVNKNIFENMQETKVSEKKGNIELYSSAITKDKVDLFKKVEGDFIKIGNIEEGVSVFFEEVEDEYFKLEDEPYYIHYSSVDRTSLEKESIDDYDNTIDIKEETYLCDLDGKQVIVIEEGITVKAERIQNDYSVIFNNNEYTLKQGDNIFDTYEEQTNEVPILMYHFFANTSEEASQLTTMFLPKSTFESQLKYLQENNFYNPTMQELERFIDGEITLPKNSVILTIDDGAWTAYRIALPLLEQYNVNSVWYIITGELENSKHPDWFIGMEQFNTLKASKNVEVHSHTHDMHGTSETETKNRMDKVSIEFGVEDINKSSEIVGNKSSFCYPFGLSGGNAKEILRLSGYTLAFKMGDGHGGRATNKSDKLEIPRLCIYRHTTQNEFISMVTNK